MNTGEFVLRSARVRRNTHSGPPYQRSHQESTATYYVRFEDFLGWSRALGAIGVGKPSSHSLPMRGPVSEQFLAFFSEKTAGDGDGVIAFFEDEPAGDETSSPLVVFRTALAAKSGNVFLRNAVDDRANSRPHAGAGAHGTGLVRGVEDEVGQVAAIAAGYVFERFQLYVLD